MEIATYRYQHATGFYPVKTFTWYEMKVELIEDTGKRWRIKFLGYHADRRGPGTITTVDYKSIKRSGGDGSIEVKDPKPVEKINPFRQYDADEIRKPYKDG